MTVDHRGLHPKDSGKVYAVKVPGHRNPRRRWYKHPGEARGYAGWLQARGVEASVLTYTISDERKETR